MLAILLGGKNLTRKTFLNLSHAVMHPGGNEWSHAHALSLCEKGNRHKLITSVETPLSFNMSPTSKKTERCKFGSSNGLPPNWDYCNIDIRAGLSSKLFASMASPAMLEEMPWTPKAMKPQSVLLWPPPILAINEETAWAFSLCFSILNFFLLEQKVLSIFGSN